MVLLLVKESMIGQVSRLSIGQVKLGLKGYTGNKGAMAFRFELLGSSFCFINSHLAAHKHNFRLRNENINTIIRGLKFQLPDTSTSIFEHDYIFWFGDLNYRLDDISIKKIIKYIAIRDFQSCLEHDQLNNARKFNNILADFNEGPIEFLPTFKYLIGSNQHNVRRDPAWCDRILWKGHIILNRYGSCDSIQISDHKPVFAYFDLELKKKDFDKMIAIKNAIYKEIDDVHHEAMPKAVISVDRILFEGIRYKHEYRQSFEIKNIGSSSLTFEIIMEKWIKCIPSKYNLASQEFVSIDVILKIDFDFMKTKRNSDSLLPSFIRIQILQGNEYLIQLEYNVFDTFIGYPCDILCTKFASAEFHNLPYPLVRIVEYLKANSLKVKNLFDTIVDNHSLANAIMKIDKNEEFDESINSFTIAAVLMEFLRHLEEPIFDGEIIDQKFTMIHVIGYNFVKSQVFEAMKSSNSACLKYITDLMKSLVGNSYYNGVTSTHLAHLIYHLTFRSDNILLEKKKNRIIFLEMLFYG